VRDHRAGRRAEPRRSLLGESGSLAEEQIFASDPDQMVVVGSNWTRARLPPPGRWLTTRPTAPCLDPDGRPLGMRLRRSYWSTSAWTPRRRRGAAAARRTRRSC